MYTDGRAPRTHSPISHTFSRVSMYLPHKYSQHIVVTEVSKFVFLSSYHIRGFASRTYYLREAASVLEPPLNRMRATINKCRDVFLGSKTSWTKFANHDEVHQPHLK